MSRPVLFQIESGTEGKTHFDLVDGPHKAYSLSELKDIGCAVLLSDGLPPSMTSMFDWEALWDSVQETEGSFLPVTARWAGRWLRVSSLSPQEYQEDIGIERRSEASAALSRVGAKTIENLADELVARREMLASLVEAFYPADKVIYRTMSGVWTGAEMAAEIRSGAEIGRNYATSLLEVCRDALARQAQRGS